MFEAWMSTSSFRLFLNAILAPLIFYNMELGHYLWDSRTGTSNFISMASNRLFFSSDAYFWLLDLARHRFREFFL